VPLHMLASVGFVKEEALNIVPIKIGDINNGGGDSATNDIYDLAVLYTKTPQIAEHICSHLAQCFQYVYRESMSALDSPNDERGKFATIQSTSTNSSSPFAERISFANFENANRANDKQQQQVCHPSTTLSTSTTTTATSGSHSSKNTIELINDYLTMLSACLTHEELNKFAVLMKRWRAKEMPILEFAQKLMELYGMERKHLLARMKNLLRGVSREDLEALSNFLCANGVTENAAESSISPLWTADMSLTTDEDGNSPIVDNISGCSGNWSSGAFAASGNAGVTHNANGPTSSTSKHF